MTNAAGPLERCLDMEGQLSMSADLGVVLALLVAAIIMFAIGRPRTDAVALLMLTRSRAC